MTTTKLSKDLVGLLTLIGVALMGLMVVGSAAWSNLSDQGQPPPNVLPLALRTPGRALSPSEGRAVPRPATANSAEGIALLQNWEYTVFPPPVSQFN